MQSMDSHSIVTHNALIDFGQHTLIWNQWLKLVCSHNLNNEMQIKISSLSKLSHYWTRLASRDRQLFSAQDKEFRVEETAIQNPFYKSTTRRWYSAYWLCHCFMSGFLIGCVPNFFPLRAFKFYKHGFQCVCYEKVMMVSVWVGVIFLFCWLWFAFSWGLDICLIWVFLKKSCNKHLSVPTGPGLQCMASSCSAVRGAPNYHA